jgi:B12-binding domain/radical SAM domain protein of rhizo-twelve system
VARAWQARHAPADIGVKVVKVALVNPPWSFEGSVYFGCREPHLPLEYGYAQALLEKHGHEVLLVDAHTEGLRTSDVRRRLEAFEPAMTVVTTAPSYLFWRCAPPELRVPQQLVASVREVAGTIVVVGPHASTTPRATLRKLGAQVAVMGECEEVLARLASAPRGRWANVDSIAVADGAQVRIQGREAACDVARLPALRWPRATIAAHLHHHHRFDRRPSRPGAEVEASRGCPYHRAPGAKQPPSQAMRRRPPAVVLREIDALVAQGVEYVYFVDEVFAPDPELLLPLCERDVAFGVQIRLDDWTDATVELLGHAGCVSIEAGIEGAAADGSAETRRMSPEALIGLLAHARSHVPFVQANLVETDPPEENADLRERLQRHGIWAHEPAPVFPYPGSPDYLRRWGTPDDAAWERAHTHYLAHFAAFTDVPGAQPLSLSQLELPDGR